MKSTAIPLTNFGKVSAYLFNLFLQVFVISFLTVGDATPQAVKRKKPVSTLGEDPPKFLELALAVDHTVIKFHGKQRVQQYVLTLLNIVSR